MTAESRAPRRRVGRGVAVVALMMATSMLGGCALAMLNGAASSGGSSSAPPPARSSTDDAISTAVRSKLAVDPAVKAFNFSVDTHDGVVTLRGRAANVGQRNAAQTEARAVKGVKSVQNFIAVR